MTFYAQPGYYSNYIQTPYTSQTGMSQYGNYGSSSSYYSQNAYPTYSFQSSTSTAGNLIGGYGQCPVGPLAPGGRASSR